MGVKHWVRALLVVSALPATAAALGLGEIRLNSPLNAPLDAEIELVNASPEELAGLRAQLASRETFARYGLEWPTFLASVTLSRAKSLNGADVLRVRSSEAITEPFVTLLVDANWGRGRLVREYTLLLDPPMFSPAKAPVAPVQAAVTPPPRESAVERSATRPAPPARESGPEQLRVRRGDTLSGIAARAVVQPEISLEQAMVGLYRSNPRAFDGTMNDLRAGSVLRLPESAYMTAISREAAIAEVRRQVIEWRNRGTDAAVPTDGAGRLRLVPPSEAPAAAAMGAGSGDPAGIKALRERLGSLEQELTESRRQLDLRAAEIAALQARLSGSGAVPVPVQPPAASGAIPAAPATPADELAAAAATAAAPETAVPVPEAPVAATRPPVQTRPSTPVVEQPEPVSMVDSIIGALERFWWVAAGLLALLAGFLGFRRWQQQRPVESELSDLVLPTPPDLTSFARTAADATVATTSETSRLRRPNFAAPQENGGFLVEESGEYDRPVAQAEAVAPVVAAEDPSLGRTGNLKLDQGDPLAEADFHMAYGLYDQAADLVKLAIGREPKRRDLKLKLAEVYFVWGNRDDFLATARQLHEMRAAGASGEWDKVIIMGGQIAPEDPLFAGVSVSGSGTGADSALDLPLGEGEQPLDFDLVGDGITMTQRLDATASGKSLSKPEIDSPTETFHVGQGELERGASLRFTDSPTMESARLDLDLGDELSESPTIEQPGLSSSGGLALRRKLDAALRQNDPSIDRTAELAVDDLGLDLGELEKLVGGDDDGADVIDLSERRNERAQQQSAATLAQQAGPDSSATALIEAPEAQGLDIDFDLSAFENPDTARNPGAAGVSGRAAPDADISATMAAQPEAAENELLLNATEPATISEVGTKLDLARAYIDMGDPDGARTILLEVLQEGSVRQKQEAQRLVEALPG